MCSQAGTSRILYFGTWPSFLIQNQLVKSFRWSSAPFEAWCWSASCASARPLTSSTRHCYNKWFTFALGLQSLAPQAVLSCKAVTIRSRKMVLKKRMCYNGLHLWKWGDSNQESSAMPPQWICIISQGLGLGESNMADYWRGVSSCVLSTW